MPSKRPRPGCDLGHDRAQAVARPERPAQVGPGSRAVVRSDVLDGEALVADHRRGGRERHEQRLEVREAPRDRQRAGQVSEPGAVRRDEQDTSPTGGAMFVSRRRVAHQIPAAGAQPSVRSYARRRSGAQSRRRPRAGRGLPVARVEVRSTALREPLLPPRLVGGLRAHLRRRKRFRRSSGQTPAKAPAPAAPGGPRGSARLTRARGTCPGESPSRRRLSCGSAPPTTRSPGPGCAGRPALRLRHPRRGGIASVADDVDEPRLREQIDQGRRLRDHVAALLDDPSGRPDRTPPPARAGRRTAPARGGASASKPASNSERAASRRSRGTKRCSPRTRFV